MFDNWVFWALLSALFAGITAVLAKAGVADTDSNLATAIRTTVACLFAWVLAFGIRLGTATANNAGSTWTVSRRTWILLILSGIATGLSWVCYFRAMQLGPASRVAPIDKLSIVFVLVFAGLFLGETLDWKTLIGGGLIVAGAIILAVR